MQCDWSTFIMRTGPKTTARHSLLSFLKGLDLVNNRLTQLVILSRALVCFMQFARSREEGKKDLEQAIIALKCHLNIVH